jgi:tetratricopeptide (TPR) repeat protein
LKKGNNSLAASIPTLPGGALKGGGKNLAQGKGRDGMRDVTHYMIRNRRGGLRLDRRTIGKRMRSSLIALNDKLRKLHNVFHLRKLYKHLSNLSAVFFLLLFFGCFQITGLKEKVQREPDNSTLLLELGKAHFDDKRYEEAKKVFKEAISIDQSNVEAYKWFVLTLREIVAKGYDEKIYEDANYLRKLAFEGCRALDKAVRFAPEDGELRLLRGITGVEMPFFVHKLEQGIDDLNRVLKSDVPDSTKAEALHWLGKAYEKKAMSYWIKVVSKDPNSKASKAVFDRMRPAVRRFDLSQYQLPVLAIDFILGFRDELEPQTAVWIEDREGNFVKTIYVSGFSGHVKEKQSRLPKWANSSKFVDVDAVTGASINLGHHIYVWDLKDSLGRRVKAGEYVVKVEVAYWPSRQYQLVSAAVNLGEKGDRSVVEQGKFVPYLEVIYFPVRGR